MKPLVSLWRRQGLRLIIYLDDILLINSSPEGLEGDVQFVCETLQWFGFVINWEKSTIQPVQSLKFLGLVLNTLSLTLSVPDEKIKDLIKECRKLLLANSVMLQDLSHILGKIMSLSSAISSGTLFSRSLQLDLREGLHRVF